MNIRYGRGRSACVIPLGGRNIEVGPWWQGVYVRAVSLASSCHHGAGVAPTSRIVLDPLASIPAGEVPGCYAFPCTTIDAEKSTASPTTKPINF